MAANPACRVFLPQLSPFIDGELAPSERRELERHLTACPDCTSRVADFRAESGLIRIGMEMLADEVDFRDFAQKVMARVTPEKLPLLDRIRMSLSEMFLYQQRMVLTVAVSAAVAVAVAVPVVQMMQVPYGYAANRMSVAEVNVSSDAHVAPVVMTTEGGDAIIWLVDHDDYETSTSAKPDGGSGSNDDEDVHQRTLQQKRPNGGEL